MKRIKKVLVGLIILLTSVLVLTGCSSKTTNTEQDIQTYETKHEEIKTRLAFHLEGYEKNKIVFAEDGYIYKNDNSTRNELYKTNQKWYRHGDVITVWNVSKSDGKETEYVSRYEIYKLYDNDKYLVYETKGNNAMFTFYVAE